MDHRPHLDRTELRDRDVTGQRQGLVEIVGLQHVVAARHLGTLGIRAVGDRRVVGPTGDAGSGRRPVQRVARPDRGPGLGVKSLEGCHALGPLFGGEFDVLADQ